MRIMGAMEEFVSEQIDPRPAAFDTAPMGRGEPGLPTGFRWRDRWYAVVERLRSWKQSAAEGGRPGGEVYLRRHCHRLRMSDGGVWTVYFVRQTPKSGSPKQRWFLLSIEHPDAAQ
jgi:hypothetical protein